MALVKIKNALSLLRLHAFDTTTEAGRSKERYRRVMLASIASVSAKIVLMLAGLITIPITLHYLGEERFGFWMAANTLLVFMRFADFGIGSGLVNAITEADGRDDRETVRRYASSGFFMLAGIGVIVFIAATIALLFLPMAQWMGVSELAQREVTLTLFILFGYFAVRMPISVVQRLQLGHQEIFRWSVFEMVGAVMGLFMLLLAVYLQAGLPILVFMVTGAPLLAQLTNATDYYLRARPELSPHFGNFSLESAKSLMTAGSIFLLLHILALFAYTIDNILIANFLGAAAVAPFAVVQRVFQFLRMGRLILTPLWPAFGEAAAREDDAWVRKTLVRAITASCIFTLLLVIPLSLFGRQVIQFWINDKVYIKPTLLYGFCCWAIVNAYTSSVSVYLNCGKLYAKQLWFFAPACISSFILKYWLMADYGAQGAIWATVIGFGTFYIIPSAIMIRHEVWPKSIGTVPSKS